MLILARDRGMEVRILREAVTVRSDAKASAKSDHLPEERTKYRGTRSDVQLSCSLFALYACRIAFSYIRKGEIFL